MIYGPLTNSLLIGIPVPALSLSGGTAPATFAMATINRCVSLRFMAMDSRDIASVWINWSAVSSPGTVELRIETNDATTLKATGTLYDASATKVFTPTAGWQLVTFASLPTAGLTPGTLYHVVLITTGTGTTQTLSTSMNIGTAIAPYNAFPLGAYTASDGSTRSNLTEISTSVLPIASFVMEDAAEELFGFCPFTVKTTFGIYGTRALAAKITLLAPMKVAGIMSGNIQIATAASVTDDFIVDIRDATTGAVISGTSVQISKKGWPTDFANRSITALFPASVTLPAGAYRVCVRNANTGTGSGAAFSFFSVGARSSVIVPQSNIASTTTDITAGTPTWTDTATDVATIGLLGSDLVASRVANPGLLSGGML